MHYMHSYLISIPPLFPNLIVGGIAHSHSQLQVTSPKHGQMHIFLANAASIPQTVV